MGLREAIHLQSQVHLIDINDFFRPKHSRTKNNTRKSAIYLFMLFIYFFYYFVKQNNPTHSLPTFHSDHLAVFIFVFRREGFRRGLFFL